MIIVAIGANLPGPGGRTPLRACQLAVAALHDMPGLRVTAVSDWYATAAVPPSGQPDYVNGVARIDGEADPATLLAGLHRIEDSFGRRRSVANAARTLDLDVIAIGDTVRIAPDPVVPHPRMHQRGFVLRPMLDVAPHWRHPVLDLTTSELFARLAPEERLAARLLARSHLRDGQPPTI